MTTDHQPRPAATAPTTPDPDPATLPGRAVDIVHAAAQRAGIDVSHISVYLPYREVSCYTRDASGYAARTMLDHLGANEPRRTNTSVDGQREELTANSPAMGWSVSIWANIETPQPVVDPAALIAEVDAARRQATTATAAGAA